MVANAASLAAKAALAKLQPAASPYLNDPVGWVRDRLGEHLWTKQVEIAESIPENRYTAVHSCHDSGKSYVASRLSAWWIDVHPPGSAFVVTTAPTNAQVNTILWREISRAHRKGGLVGRVTLDARWRLGADHGEEIVAFGRKPADYNPEAFQGIHQTYVLVVIDEANGVPKTLYDAVDTIVTNRNGRVLAIGNPDSPTSYFSQVCKNNSGWNVIHIDGFDTPNFTGESVPETLKDDLLSTEWVEERKTKWGIGSPLWQSKVRGLFPTVSDDALIQPDWWESAAGQDLPAENYTGQFGVDVARYGTDHTVCYKHAGGRLRLQWTYHKDDTMETADRVQKWMISNPGVPTLVDETGVGAGVVDRLRQMQANASGFVSSSKPSDLERFDDRRSEAYWHLRELFEKGLLDVDSDDEQLRSELTSMRWGLTSKGKIKIESKEDYVKRLGTHSPDNADAAMMACWEAPAWDADLMDHVGDQPAVTHELLEVLW